MNYSRVHFTHTLVYNIIRACRRAAIYPTMIYHRWWVDHQRETVIVLCTYVSSWTIWRRSTANRYLGVRGSVFCCNCVCFFGDLEKKPTVHTTYAD